MTIIINKRKNILKPIYPENLPYFKVLTALIRIVQRSKVSGSFIKPIAIYNMI